METFYSEKLSNLEMATNDLEVEADCSIQRMEAVIYLILECLSDLKEYVLKRGFKNTDEETQEKITALLTSSNGEVEVVRWKW